MVTTIFTEMTALAQRTGAINLGQGFPDEDGPKEIVGAAVEAMRAGHNQYAPLPGVTELRAAVAGHQAEQYGLRVDADTGVQVTFGATEAVAAALLAFVGEGDEVIALDPGYDSYRPIAERAGGTLRPIELEPPRWRVTAEAIDAAITPHTRVLLLNSPHNPTGRVLDRDELDLLARACEEHDLLAVTDEVYEHLVFAGEHVPLATLPGMFERTVTVSSLGKTHSLTGWKVGWASGQPELIARVRELKQFLTFAGGTPFQYAAAHALTLTGEARALARTLATKRDRLADGLQRAGFAVLPTEGTYFLNADAAPLGHADAAALCRELPAQAGVAAIPLQAFAARPERLPSLVRFAFCKREDVLDTAIAHLCEWAK